MSLTTRAPLRVTGANVNSGFPNTGEINVSDGGERTACVWSGSLLTNASLTGCPTGAVTSGGHILLWTGAGRLNRVYAHDMLTSGLAVTFYDAAAISVSGVSVSGQRFLGKIPARSRGTLAVASGSVDTVVSWDDILNFQMPFSSGLCVAAASGAPGFTASFTPETNPPLS